MGRGPAFNARMPTGYWKTMQKRTTADALPWRPPGQPNKGGAVEVGLRGVLLGKRVAVEGGP